MRSSRLCSARREPAAEFEPEDVETAPATEPSAGLAEPAERRARLRARSSTGPPGSGEDDELRDVAVPMAASDEEVLRSKRFDALAPGSSRSSTG